MRVFIALVLVAVLLAGCGGGGPGSVTSEQVIDRFKQAGLDVQNPRPDQRPDNSPLPNTFRDWLVFEVAGADPGKGGQVFTCATKKDCDAIYKYYSLLPFPVPYLYQSSGGTVIVQMNDGLRPEVAAKYEAAIKDLP